MQLVNAYIDLRFDSYPIPVDVNGYLVNSVQEIAPLLDKLKVLGFNSISMAVQVPLDMRTGQIYLGSFSNHDNKALPQDLWKIVDYAHSIGMSVNLEALPSSVYFADGTWDNTDANLNASMSLGAGVTVSTIFNSISTYQKTIASLAQQHSVEMLTIGNNNWGYDSQTYAQYWQNDIQGIKSVFSGKLAYEAYWDNAIWSMTDVVQFQVIPLISTTPIYDLATIVEDWYHANGGIGRGDAVSNYVQLIADIAHKYSNKQILLADYRQYAIDNGIGDTITPFNYTFNGQDVSQLPLPNYREQVLAYEAFVYLAKYVLGNSINGFGVTEFGPWLQGAWIQQNPLYKWDEQVGDDLWNRPDVLNAIQQSLSSNPLPNYFFSTPSNDAIKGNAGALNTAVFYSSYASSKITTSATGVITVSNTSDGTDSLTNIQRLQFGDGAALSYDIAATQTAGSSYMLYKAAFNRAPDTPGLGFWISKMDGGMDYNTVAQNFVNSTEFKTAYGGSNPSVNTLVTKLYNNVLTRNPDGGGLAFWQEKLSTGGWTTANVLGYFATSAENVANVTSLIANGIPYQEWVG